MSFTSHPAAEAAIRAELERWLDAVRARNVPAIMQHYAPGIRAFDAIAQLQFQGVPAYTAHWQTCMDYCPGDMMMRLQDVQVSAGQEIGFVSALCQCGVIGEDGKEDSSWMRMTAFYQREGQDWKVVHEHFSAPFDPESFQALLDLKP